MRSFCLLLIPFFITLLWPHSNAQGQNIVTIQSKQLKVSVDNNFPRIAEYCWKATAASIKGQSKELSTILINGEEFTPRVTSVANTNKVQYSLDFQDIDIHIDFKIEVVNNVVEFDVTKVIENGAFKVHTIEIPHHNLISIQSNEKNGVFSGSKMYTAVEGNGDTFQKLNPKTPTDSIPQGYLYAIVNNDKLSCALWTNAVQEKTDKYRIIKQTTSENDHLETAIWSGSWIYRANKMDAPSPLPKAKIVVTVDKNSDGIVDWQDGAIAYRKILNTPKGANAIPNLVVQRIPMNFASQATNPFTKSLDETKRIYLNTDGLGQYVILKGYNSEGHDSKHPDYGDIGVRQGGAEEMNVLCNAAPKYGAMIGVHINGTESYPEASAFNETLINKTKPGWNWLDPSYYMDKRYDAASGNRYRRLKSLKDQVPGLDFIYVDVWYAKGSWDSRKLAREIHSLDLMMATEFPMDHEYDAIWNHWAVDYNYGGKTIKGYNSKIVRFIRNHQKDTWIARNPILGGAEMVDFEGWQGRVDFDACINVTFETNLPTKYLQHFPIIKWDDKTITFKNDVKASVASGHRVITKNDIIILKEGSYLLPWNPNSEDKLYHWNTNGGKTSWTLPNLWNDVKSVFLYRLTDLGRVLEKEISVVDGAINITAKASTPYVIYKTKKASDEPINWGEGTLVKDPGFNSGDLSAWNVKGKGASVKRDTLGQYSLNITKGKGAIVSQNISNLAKGHYFASVYVATDNNRKASLGVKVDGNDISNYATSSLWNNYIAADSKHDSKMQRMFVHFDINKHHQSIELYLKAEKGNGTVLFDDVRLKPIKHIALADSIYFKETFENIPAGIYPFVKGEGGGVNDPRVHLSQLHAPFTQKGWNGKKVDDVINGEWSLKLHEDASGLIIQTIPQTLRFMPGKNYTVSFSYQAEGTDYSFVIGDGNKNVITSQINPQLTTRKYTVTFTASQSGNSWIGVLKNSKNESDFVIDDLMVVEDKE